MPPVYYPGPVPPDVPSRKAYVTADYLREEKQALHDAQFALYMLYGGRDGVLGYGDVPEASLKVAMTSPASMRVTVSEGAVSAFETVRRKRSATLTGALAAPVSNPMIYLVQFNVGSGAVSVKAGAEAAVPEAPTADAYCIPLAQVYVQVGATSIKDANDGVNGYIVDARSFVNL